MKMGVAIIGVAKEMESVCRSERQMRANGRIDATPKDALEAGRPPNIAPWRRASPEQQNARTQVNKRMEL